MEQKQHQDLEPPLCSARATPLRLFPCSSLDVESFVTVDVESFENPEIHGWWV